MPKRPGENLARTSDGSTYNKLQRPDNWPVEPARSAPADSRDDSDVQEDSHADEEPPMQFSQRSRKRQKHTKRQVRVAENGCLPMDDGDFSESDDISFAAIEYLKSVRAQANDLPGIHVDLVDQKQEEDDNRGYFEDGTYTAAPQLGPQTSDYYEDVDGWDEEEIDEAGDRVALDFVTHISPCEAYTNALLSRFRQVREVIQTTKASVDFQVTAETRRLQVPQILRKKECSSWQQTMSDNAPRLSAIAATPRSSIVSLLGVINQLGMRPKQNVRKNTSLWLLSLLASIDEATIDGDIIYELRELAKKAIWLRIDFEPRFEAASAAMAAEAGYDKHDVEIHEKDHQASSEEVSGMDNVEGVILDDLLIDENVPNDTTKATLDMVVAIVGEVFGQRDLLESRSVVDWPSAEEDVEVDMEPDGEDG